MSLFANLANNVKVEKNKDIIPSGFEAVETGIYDCTVKLLYAGVSKQGAQFLKLELKTDTGAIVKETFYITNRQGQNFYTKDKKNFHLPGFITMDELCAVTTGQLLASQDTDTRTIKEYDFETRGEKEKEVPVLVDVIGKNLKVAIKRIKMNKRSQNDAGEWVDTAETKVINEVDKVFDVDGFTFNELMEQKETPEFIEKWKARFDGKDIDKTSKQASNIGIGIPGAAPSANTPQGIPSLFAKKG